jgi:hypothetical protein
MVKIGPYKAAQEHHSEGSSHGATDGAHGAGAEHATNAAGGHVADAARAGADHVAHVAVESATPATDALQKTNMENFFHYNSDLTGGYGLPGLLEIGIFLGFAALFVYFILSRLEKAALVPTNDPYLEETLHHHV